MPHDIFVPALYRHLRWLVTLSVAGEDSRHLLLVHSSELPEIAEHMKKEKGVGSWQLYVGKEQILAGIDEKGKEVSTTCWHVTYCAQPECYDREYRHSEVFGTNCVKKSQGLLG